ncbi:MAG: class II fructose-bisphosphate aldolase [Oscillospiraceae bacterium]|jgi:fructose-bisphosphate aldolase class II|nr:class II fructose-bisphosphate aldolase [Oscillospiraceae bacterium]
MLVSPEEILLPAFRAGRLVGAFNTGNMEMTMGILRAAEELDRPVLLQIAEKRLKHSPLALMGPLMAEAARRAKTPVAVQLDHGERADVMEQALGYGFTGIMFDGSALPLEENIARTRGIAAPWIEGEIGVLAGSEGGPEAEALFSDPAQAERFARESGCSCLAVSIGNAHGFYRGKPKLNFGILAEIHRRLPDTPLVLHGGTGIPKEDLARAARLGICKVNIATAGFAALYQAARTGEAGDYFALSAAMAAGVYENTKKLLRWFEEIF